MKWDRRLKPTEADTAKELLPTDLPYDYLRLVETTLNQAFNKGLIELRKIHPASEFFAGGVLFPNEVLLTVTLHHGEKTIFATTVHASTDFTTVTGMDIGVALEKALGACVDAASAVFDFYLDATSVDKIAQLADPSLGALEECPYDWTLIDKTKPSVWVKMDKSNPKIESLTEKWLSENDPDYHKKTNTPDTVIHVEAEEFLEERLDAIKKARDGGFGSGGQNGPIRH